MRYTKMISYTIWFMIKWLCNTLCVDAFLCNMTYLMKWLCHMLCKNDFLCDIIYNEMTMQRNIWKCFLKRYDLWWTSQRIMQKCFLMQYDLWWNDFAKHYAKILFMQYDKMMKWFCKEMVSMRFINIFQRYLNV